MNVSPSYMFKTLIAPIQKLLLRNGQCVGCGRSLSAGKVIKNKQEGDLIKCQCERIFVKAAKGYRRALVEEVDKLS